MCGITGAIELAHKSLFSFNSDSIYYRYLASRGPQSSGYANVLINNYKITLGHTRLAIIDLSNASSQPMRSEDGRYILSYNGEIFNYKEVRTELKKKGLSFLTEGDTEVLLKAWQQWGPESLKRLNGMFAFSLLDKQEQNLYLVRDRFGVKPLLYTITGENELYFSSSISALASISGGEPDLEYMTVGLRFGFFEGYEAHSPFKNVKYVLPGTFLKFSFTNQIVLKEYTWYSLTEEVAKKEMELSQYSEKELVERGQSLLKDAVRLRLRSDVPLAISLSGGVDSSIIAALAKEETQGLNGFCYGSPQNLKSEGPIVERFSRCTNLNIHFIHPFYSAKQLGDSFDRTLAAQEAPFLGLSIIAQQEVYKAVKEHGVTVLLGGQGGDEIFAGYRKFFFIALRSALNDRRIGDSIYFLYSLGLLLTKGIDDYRLYWREKQRYINKTGKHISIISNLPLLQMDITGGKNMTLKMRQIEDVQHYSLPSLLRYEDRNSMSWSIESRLPFMDYRIVEFGIALQDQLKIRNGYGKWISRRIMRDKVPAFILRDRKKRGFDVTQNWISEGIGERIKTHILENKNKLKPYVNDFSKVENRLSIFEMEKDGNLFDEAMMLAYLAKPIQNPI